MFTENEKQIYRNIKAPEELRQKIISSPQKSKRIIPFISIAAACFILVISGFLINSGNNKIIINGQTLKNSIVFYDTASMSGRSISSSLSIPIELEISRETEVSVSQGFLSFNGQNPTKQLKLSSSSTIWWEIEPDKSEKTFNMQISDKKGVTKVTLSYENGKITITKGE